ncbi:MAG: C-terminal binding protein [Granulosicoccus sp.]
MSAMKVVITDASFPDVAAERLAAEAAAAEFVRCDCKTAEEVTAAVAGANVVVVQFAPLTRTAIEGLASGSTAIRYGVGYNNFDLDALNDNGIRAAYVPDYCTDEVADHTAATVLCFMRKLLTLDASVRAGQWDAVGTVRPLKAFKDSKIGFLGFGRIAQEVCARLRPFGLRFIACDPFMSADSGVDVESVDLDTLLADSDCLCLHAPSTDETVGVIGAAALKAMKSSACVINSARGDLIDEKALAEALKIGEISGAGLDVFAVEPLPDDSPLRDAPNVLLSPHAAWYSEVAVERLQGMVAGEITRALSGQPVRQSIPGSTV